MTQIQITDRIRQKIVQLAQEYQLSLVVLFGSQSRGDTHAQSDVDIAYRAVEPLSLESEGMLIVELMQIFQTEKIDLASLRLASPLLLHEIAVSGQPLYEQRPGNFNDFYVYAMRRYEEARPLFRLRSEYLKKYVEGLAN